MTPTAIVGLLAGAKAVKTASLLLLPLVPFWAVPVFPAIWRPCAPALLTGVAAVPLCTTASISCFSYAATAGVIGWLSTLGVAELMTDRSEAVTCWIR